MSALPPKQTLESEGQTLLTLNKGGIDGFYPPPPIYPNLGNYPLECGGKGGLSHWNVVPSIHIRCKMTASLRTTARVARLRPFLRISRRPPCSKSASFTRPHQEHIRCRIAPPLPPFRVGIRRVIPLSSNVCFWAKADISQGALSMILF